MSLVRIGVALGKVEIQTPRIHGRAQAHAIADGDANLGRWIAARGKLTRGAMCESCDCEARKQTRTACTLCGGSEDHAVRSLSFFGAVSRCSKRPDKRSSVAQFLPDLVSAPLFLTGRERACFIDHR